MALNEAEKDISKLSNSSVSEEVVQETTAASELKTESVASDRDASVVDKRALLMRMDLRFIPWPSFLYFLCFLDRASIGNARLYGLENDLKITDKQYLLALTVFFISYWACEVPSNIILKRLRPSIWLPTIIIIWGICMTCQGLVHNYSGLLAVRWWLGAFESGFFPGVTYSISCWYKRSEFGFRLAVFSSMATVSGAFGGLLAVAISNMDGVGGKRGWAWIFILEGLVTIIAGIISFWMIVDFPDTSKFITEAEREYIIRKMDEDGQFSVQGESFKIKYLWQSLRDPKTWLSMLLAAGYDGPLYAFSLFTPSIINQLFKSYNFTAGFKATPANLLSVPIYVFAGLLTCVVGYYADRLGNRGYFNLVCLGVGMAGYSILIASRNAAVSYFAIYLASAGIYPVIATSTVWFSHNAEGSYKRGVTIAMAIGFGNLQGAVASNVYRASDTPWYTLGHSIQLGYICMSFAATSALIFLLRTENMRRDRGERDEVILEGEKGANLDEELVRRGKLNGIYHSVADARRDKGDAWSGFRYQL